MLEYLSGGGVAFFFVIIDMTSFNFYVITNKTKVLWTAQVAVVVFLAQNLLYAINQIAIVTHENRSPKENGNII